MFMESAISIAEKNTEPLIERLFAAGAHYGFSRTRRHPSAVPYLFGNKQGVDIFDLEKTSALLEAAKEYLREVGARGGEALFVGTKDEARELVRARAESLGAPYAVNRWIGGTLTNLVEIRKRVAYLEALRAQEASGELERKYTKKERALLAREMEKLAFNFGGIALMDKIPAVLVVVDPRHDALAVREARDTGIPVVAVMGSDCDAALIARPVFLNDAHRASVTLALDELVAGYAEGRAAAKDVIHER